MNSNTHSIELADAAAPARVMQGRFSDFDAIVESIPDFDGEYLQVERGPVASQLARAALDRVVAIRFLEDVPAYAFQATAPAGMTSLVFAVGSASEARWRGIPVDENTLVAYGPGAEHVGRSRGRFGSVSLHIPSGALEQHAAALGREFSAAPQSAQTLAPDPVAIARLRQATQDLFGVAESAHALLDVPEVRRAHEEAILTTAALAVSSRPPEPEHAAISHRRAVRRAIEMLETRDDAPVYLAEMCEAARVSERTLRSAFQRVYGVSPIRFVQLHRMRQARRALITADPASDRVSEIAQRFGFANLGRFAVEFRELFGESPSKLLRSAR